MTGRREGEGGSHRSSPNFTPLGGTSRPSPTLPAALARTTDAAGRAVDLARSARTTLAPHLRRAVETVVVEGGPVLSQALKGQGRLWRAAAWSVLVTRGAPVVPAVLLVAHALPAAVVTALVASKVPIVDRGVIFLFCAVLVVVLVGYLAAPPAPARPDDRLWSEQRLVQALTDAGLIAAPRKGEPAVVLRRLGSPRHDDLGTAVVVELPGALTWRMVADRTDRLAAALNVAAHRLHVDHPHDDAAESHVRLWIGSGTTPPTPRAAALTTETTRWRDGVVLGVDARGRDVVWQTAPVVHSLIVGRSGSGKTVAGRALLAAALVDPSVAVYVVSGKQEAADWDAVAPLAAGYVARVDEHLAGNVTALLHEVLDLARERAATSRGRRAAPDPVLLLVDEWGAVRSSILGTAGKNALTEVDRLMGLLLATGRSGGVAVLLVTQKPTAESFPTLQRSNVVQRLVMQTTGPQDAAIGLGVDKAPANLPRRVGEALLSNDTDDARPVRVANLDDDDWERLCARAAALRGNQTDEDPAPVTDAHDEAAAATAAPLTGLLAAAHELLVVEPHGLPAATLHDLLPEHLRPAVGAQLGRALSSRPDRFEQTRDRDGRRWRAVTAAVTEPSGAVTAAVTTPPAAVTEPPVERDDSASTPAMPAAPVLPYALPPDLADWRRLPSRAETRRTT